MLGRPAALTGPALLLGVLGTLLSAGEARAHRLAADYRVLLGNKVQIEAWFDPGGSARGARVEVSRNGRAVAQGRTDRQGIFLFDYVGVEPLRVVVSAGEGHLKELMVPTSELVPVAVGTAVAALTPGPPFLPVAVQALAAGREVATAPVPRVDRTSQVSAAKVLLGVGLLLAVAVLVPVLRKVRRAR
jgi:hypothetical protein